MHTSVHGLPALGLDRLRTGRPLPGRGRPVPRPLLGRPAPDGRLLLLLLPLGRRPRGLLQTGRLSQLALGALAVVVGRGLRVVDGLAHHGAGGGRGARGRVGRQLLDAHGRGRRGVAAVRHGELENRESTVTLLAFLRKQFNNTKYGFCSKTNNTNK